MFVKVMATVRKGYGETRRYVKVAVSMVPSGRVWVCGWCDKDKPGGSPEHNVQTHKGKKKDGKSHTYMVRGGSLKQKS